MRYLILLLILPVFFAGGCAGVKISATATYYTPTTSVAIGIIP